MSSWSELRRWVQDVEGSCEYFEQAVAERCQGVTLLCKRWVGDTFLTTRYSCGIRRVWINVPEGLTNGWIFRTRQQTSVILNFSTIWTTNVDLRMTLFHGAIYHTIFEANRSNNRDLSCGVKQLHILQEWSLCLTLYCQYPVMLLPLQWKEFLCKS